MTVEPTLGARAVSGMKWSSVSNVARLVIRVVALVVLTRIVGPRAFGVMGLAIVCAGFVDLFRDLGTSAVMVQAKTATQRFLSTMFWTNVALGIVAALLTVAAAPVVERFYDIDGLTEVIRLLAVTFVLAGLGVAHQAVLTRNLDFQRLALMETATAALAAAIAIGVALAGGGVYALVVQALVTSGGLTLGAWALAGWRPSFAFALDELRASRRFASSLVGYNLVNFLARNADYILIGRFLGAESLGYYSLAYNIILFPLNVLTYSVERVMFPVFSSIQVDRERIARSFLRASAFVAGITFPMMLGLLVLCDVFVDVVYGRKWSRAIPVIAVLAPVGLVQSISALTGSIYKSQGRTDLQLRLGGLTAAFAVASFAIGLHWGIVGVAAAYAIATSGILLYPGFAIPLGLVGLRAVDLARAVRRPLAASAVMAGFLLAARLVVPATAPWLGALVLTGSAVYVAASALVNPEQIAELRRLLRGEPGPEAIAAGKA